MTTSAAPPAPSGADGRDRTGRTGRRATAASAIGFTLDFYDLYVIVFVAPVIARVFFTGPPAVAMAGAFVALAVTLLMRPVGAVLLGHVADRQGRKRAMVLGLIGVGTTTAAMGMLPTAEQAGLLAPAALLGLRLVQGLFVGGVFASTLTLATESVAPRWRGLASGLVGGGGTAAGSVLASLALLAATQAFPGPAFDEWGWRVMFLLGGLPALLGLLAHRHLDESPEWERSRDRRVRPLAELCSPRYRRTLLRGAALVFGIGTHFLLTLGLLPTFLQVVNGLPAASVAPLLVGVNLATLVCAPLAGHLSQLWGRRRVLLGLVAANVVLLPLLYWWLASLRDAGPAEVVVPALLISCLAVAAFGPMPAFLNERFDTQVRASGTALSINLGFAAGGLVPLAVSATGGGSTTLVHSVSVALVLVGGVAVVALARRRNGAGPPDPGPEERRRSRRRT